MSTTLARVKLAIGLQADIDPCDIADDALVSNPALCVRLDSLDLLELCMRLEDEFDIEIPGEDFALFTSVQSVADYIQQRHPAAV